MPVEFALPLTLGHQRWSGGYENQIVPLVEDLGSPENQTVAHEQSVQGSWRPQGVGKLVYSS